MSMGKLTSQSERQADPVEVDARMVWSAPDLADPHQLADKPVRVRRMFAGIADSYDLNNRIHSFGRDQAWRRAAVALARVKHSDVILDVACGTGDLSLAFARMRPRGVIGVDFALPMLNHARRKREQVGLSTVTFLAGDALHLPLADRSVDVVSIAFGLRNVADADKALAEFRRVLRPGGRLVILEFALPRRPLLRRAYLWYFQHVLPRTASWISGDRTGAYRYLPHSVKTYYDQQQMNRLISQAGLAVVRQQPMTLGVAVAYVAQKAR
jgi:demethylmenaquinone methyltransferase/2-methoxy-6-polyprenyl-1,4-benzoquinol methylase